MTDVHKPETTLEFLVAYIALIVTLACIATWIQPGGPF